MPLTQRELADIERQHADGLSSKQILDIFETRGERLTEATLRKYVQLGLLPRSKRVGEKGKHRGSRGIYPVGVVRRIDEIRRAMTGGETLESLARATQTSRTKLESARACVVELLDAAEADLEDGALERAAKSALKSELASIHKQGKAWLRQMDRWAAAFTEAERKAKNGKLDGVETRGTAKPRKTAGARPRRPGGV